MRSLAIRVSLVSAIAALSGCTLVSGPGVVFVDSGASVAFENLTESMNDYLNMSPSLFEEDPAAFFAEGQVRLADLREAQDEWEEAAKDSDFPEVASDGTPSASAVEEVTEAIDAWITSQEEQLVRSRDCFSSADPLTCYSSLMGSNLARWDAIAARANEASLKLAKESE